MVEMRPSEADRATFTGSGDTESGVEEYGLVHTQLIGEKGGAGTVAQARRGARQLATDMGASQADRAHRAGSGGVKPVKGHGQINTQPVGGESGTRVVA